KTKQAPIAYVQVGAVVASSVRSASQESLGARNIPDFLTSRIRSRDFMDLKTFGESARSATRSRIRSSSRSGRAGADGARPTRANAGGVVHVRLAPDSGKLRGCSTYRVRAKMSHRMGIGA